MVYNPEYVNEGKKETKASGTHVLVYLQVTCFCVLRQKCHWPIEIGEYWFFSFVNHHWLFVVAINNAVFINTHHKWLR